MFEAYSLNVEVAVDTAIPFNNVTIKKCCDISQNGVSTIQLNKCGVYEVSLDGSTAAVASVQLFKDGVAQPQAQSTGTSLGFNTLVQVPNNNTCCPCSSPTLVQIKNIGDAAATFTNANITVRKIS